MPNIFGPRHTCARTHRLAYRGDFMFHGLVSWRWIPLNEVQGQRKCAVFIKCFMPNIFGQRHPCAKTNSLANRGDFMFHCLVSGRRIPFNEVQGQRQCANLIKCFLPNIFGHRHPCARTNRLANRGDFMFHVIVSGRRSPIEWSSRSKIMRYFS